jgi:hypothetical protein
MMAKLDQAFRVALWDEWGHTCAWCGNPLDLEDLEVEHLVAKGLEAEDLAKELARHGLPADLDVDATRNLVPAHGRPCNRRKAMKPLPDSPIIDNLLADAEARAPAVDQAADKYRRSTSVTRAVAIIEAADPAHMSDEQRRRVVSAAATVDAHLGLQQQVRVHASVDPHDYVPPEVIEAGAIFGTDRMGELLQEWDDLHGLDDVVEAGFNSDGEELRRSNLRRVTRIGYVEETDMYLVRADFDVSHTHYDRDGIGGPANTEITLDLWAELDDARIEILDLSVDYFDNLPPLEDAPGEGGA